MIWDWFLCVDAFVCMLYLFVVICNWYDGTSFIMVPLWYGIVYMCLQLSCDLLFKAALHQLWFGFTVLEASVLWEPSCHVKYRSLWSSFHRSLTLLGLYIASYQGSITNLLGFLWLLFCWGSSGDEWMYLSQSRPCLLMGKFLCDFEICLVCKLTKKIMCNSDVIIMYI